MVAARRGTSPAAAAHNTDLPLTRNCNSSFRRRTGNESAPIRQKRPEVTLSVEVISGCCGGGRGCGAAGAAAGAQNVAASGSPHRFAPDFPLWAHGRGARHPPARHGVVRSGPHVGPAPAPAPAPCSLRVPVRSSRVAPAACVAAPGVVLQGWRLKARVRIGAAELSLGFSPLPSGCQGFLAASVQRGEKGNARRHSLFMETGEVFCKRRAAAHVSVPLPTSWVSQESSPGQTRKSCPCSSTQPQEIRFLLKPGEIGSPTTTSASAGCGAFSKERKRFYFLGNQCRGAKAGSEMCSWGFTSAFPCAGRVGPPGHSSS